MRFLLTAASVLLLTGTSFADTLHVPSEYPTIQGAIDLSVNGDTIQIAAGTYYEYEIDPGVKAITISGAINKDGSPAVTLDADDQGRVIYMGHGGLAVLENLVLQNGTAPGSNGGAMKAELSASTTITNCTFRNSNANFVGGLMCSESATIVNCRFENNSATYNTGGLLIYGGVVTDCTFTNNFAWNGGGLATGGPSDGSAGPLSITNCVFEGNTATETGGAIYLWNTPLITIDNCTITGNSANLGGGGISHTGDSDYELSNSTVCGNTPDQIMGVYTDGGGNTISALCRLDEDGILHVPSEYPTIQGAIDLSVNGDTIQIASGTYYEHQIDPGGRTITISGAINKDGSPASIIDAEAMNRVVNCGNGETLATIFENLVLDNGVGIGAGGYLEYASATFINCTFRNGTNYAGAGLVCFDGATITDCTFENNVVSDNIACLYLGGPFSVNNCVFRNNIATNGSGGAVTVEGIGGGAIGSIVDCVFENNAAAAVGAGLNLSYVGTNDVTVDNCTFVGNTAGIGGAIYVSETNSNNTLMISNSTFCENTSTDGGDQIDGTYIDGGNNSINSYCPDEDGILYVPSEYPTIEIAIDTAEQGETVLISAGTYKESGLVVDKDISVSGELGKDGEAQVTIDGELNDTVIICSSNSTFENLVITRGSSDDGGGMHITGADPTLVNCTITNNSAKRGGGIYSTASSPTITDCTITNNGAVYWQEPETGLGGGMCNVDSNPSLTNTVVSGNSGTWGGGICNTDGSTSTLVGCTVSNNVGKISGGGIYSVLSSAALQDVVFCANTPTHLIGAWDDLSGNTFEDDCEDEGPLLCIGDMNADYNVDVLDLLYIIAVWNTDNPAGDINEDGWVDVSDLLILIGAWGDCP